MTAIAPPRVRRIIPARAGNTSPRPSCRSPRADHPRAGGEHQTAAKSVKKADGSSPRGRGTLCRQGRGRDRRRIIPARAGNTAATRPSSSGATDHPRAGGEHAVWGLQSHSATGSSPRGRGTPSVVVTHQPVNRIIPARAGNTSTSTSSTPSSADHPRAGGEHDMDVFVGERHDGSSPRGRGTPDLHRSTVPSWRIIPARAGNTACAHRSGFSSPDHPRAGGEHLRLAHHRRV